MTGDHAGSAAPDDSAEMWRRLTLLARHPVACAAVVLVASLATTWLAIVWADALGLLFWVVMHAVDVPAIIGAVAIFRTGHAGARPLATALLVAGLIAWAVGGPLAVTAAFLVSA